MAHEAFGFRQASEMPLRALGPLSGIRGVGSGTICGIGGGPIGAIGSDPIRTFGYVPVGAHFSGASLTVNAKLPNDIGRYQQCRLGRQYIASVFFPSNAERNREARNTSRAYGKRDSTQSGQRGDFSRRNTSVNIIANSDSGGTKRSRVKPRRCRLPCMMALPSRRGAFFRMVMIWPCSHRRLNIGTPCGRGKMTCYKCGRTEQGACPISANSRPSFKSSTLQSWARSAPRIISHGKVIPVPIS